MAQDPTQGPVSTYDEFGNPIKANVDEPIVEAAEEVIAEDATEEESEEATTEETVEEAVEEKTTEDEASAGPEETAGDDESSEDGIVPKEDLWDRLTEVGAESDPETGVVRHVEFTCDRCGETKQGMLLPEGTVGFYALDDELGWAKYANEGEEILCDACMQLDERYLADYPDEAAAYAKVSESEEAIEGEEPAQDDVSVEGEPAAEDVAQPVGEDPAEEIERAEVGDETEKKPKEEDDPVEEEEEFVTHEHEVKPPLTYNEAETMLMETSFVKMREMAIADGIKPDRSRVKVMRQLLDLWFPAPATPAGEVEPEMSVRIRRAKGLM